MYGFVGLLHVHCISVSIAVDGYCVVTHLFCSCDYPHGYFTAIGY